MVKPFIKPITKKRNFSSLIRRYFYAPPLIYHSDADLVNPPASDAQLQTAPEPSVHQAKKSGRFAPMILAKNEVTLYQERPYKIHLLTLMKRAFIATYYFEGLDHISGELTLAENPSGDRTINTFNNPSIFNTWVLVASFLGLPTRTRQKAPKDQQPFTDLVEAKQTASGKFTAKFRNTRKKQYLKIKSHVEDESAPNTVEIQPSLDFIQLLKNFIGGWESPTYEEDKNGIKRLVWTEKMIWQLAILFPIKFPIIFAFKVIAIPFKLALNILKLFTEWLPQVITSLVAAFFCNTIEKMRKIASKKMHPVEKGLQLTGLFILTLVLGVLNYASRLFTLILQAAISPELSVRKAYAAGREYYIDGRTPEETEAFSKIFGFLAASIMVLITSTVWAITLPLVIGTLMTYIPVYLPSVFQFLSTFAQLPFITKSIAVINTVLGPVGNFIMRFTGSTYLSISTFLGVQIPTQALIMGTAIGALTARVAAIISTVADFFCNKWALWHKPHTGPVTALVAYFTRVVKPKSPYLVIPLLSDVMPQEDDTSPVNNAPKQEDPLPQRQAPAKHVSKSARPKKVSFGDNFGPNPLYLSSATKKSSNLFGDSDDLSDNPFAHLSGTKPPLTSKASKKIVQSLNTTYQTSLSDTKRADLVESRAQSQDRKVPARSRKKDLVSLFGENNDFELSLITNSTQHQ